MNDLQLEMKFTGDPGRKRLRDTINAGEFTLLIESRSPAKYLDLAVGSERLAELEKCILAITGIPASLAVLDGGNSAEYWRAAEFVGALDPEERDRHLFYFGGRNTTASEMRQLTSLALSAGARNLVAVSGEAAAGEGLADTRRHHFFESRRMLSYWNAEREVPPTLFTGCAVNPFQYTAPSLFSQYANLIRKLQSGAQFVVTQAGWDMLKLQSLCWYLRSRAFYQPLIARLILLTPERVERILGGQEPGVTISKDFQRILDQELRFSRSQFEAAQWRRLELQAAGCRLLGFSGVQVSGANTPARIATVAARITSALQEFKNFNEWLEAYNSYQARAEMAPLSTSFYLYDRALLRAFPESPLKMNVPDPTEVTWGERFRYRLRHFLFPHADQQGASERQWLKRIFAGCGGCDRCRLVQCEFICPDHCPKHLANGPCGGIRPDGSCEIAGVGECVFRRQYRLADWRQHVLNWEDRVVPPGRTDEPGDANVPEIKTNR